MNKNGNFEIEEVYLNDNKKINSIEKFLYKNDLKLGEEIIKYLTFSVEGEIVATGAIAEGGIIKCVAIDPYYRGEGIVLKLFTELTHLCFDLGFKDLFVYTKPENERIFKDCGCFKIESSSDVILMENSKDLLSNYCNDLKDISKEIKGKKIGSVVLNADPFTLGHQFLIESAASLCDWLHVFVVKEDSAFFSYEDRFNLVKKGISHLDNVTLYEGSRYIISKATFPSYFLKSEKILDNNYAELDLKIFRHYIAPSLNITNRFVGTEPKSPITNKYNQEMKYWFEEAKMDYPEIKVSIIERKTINGEPISASRVRELFKNNEFDKLKLYVPKTTYNFLLENKKN
ncbi:[citrate (pro-3S)-lyase] ligase [Chishuiella sp.]|uniref:[citrate (pro-3S)-lyase] ligase n=1 Tax=Chishuiella sp. TaxID=1969467 RepID=UPI0028A7D54A|nr:[citrate (pro-3S)-lyase] ligase [Chishuiella sp.]